MSILGILVAGFSAFIIGALWYSPLLFGKMWMKLSNIDPKHMNTNFMPLRYLIGLIGAIITAFTINIVFECLSVYSLGFSLRIAYVLWLGFIVTTMLGTVLWEGKPVKLFVINAGYYLVMFSAMSAIIYIFQTRL